MEVLISSDLKDLPEIAKTILARFKENRIFTFTGDLGAGKTTLIKAICNQLGIEDEVNSPTYSIINEYDSPAGSVFHMDLYRLKNSEEVEDIGLEDYFYSDAYCFVEWPAIAANYFPESTIHLLVNINDKKQRFIELHEMN